MAKTKSKYKIRCNARRSGAPMKSRIHEGPPPWLRDIFSPRGVLTVAEKEAELVAFSLREIVNADHEKALRENDLFNLKRRIEKSRARRGPSLVSPSEIKNALVAREMRLIDAANKLAGEF